MHNEACVLMVLVFDEPEQHYKHLQANRDWHFRDPTYGTVRTKHHLFATVIKCAWLGMDSRACCPHLQN